MKKSKNKIICFDLDDVICKTKAKKYFLAKPYPKVIKKINNLYSKGYYIKIFTARFMGRNTSNTPWQRIIFFLFLLNLALSK